jgi:hypothetical protein
LNFTRWLVAGSLLWHWKPHWAFNRRFLLSATPTSWQVTVHFMAYKHTQWPQWASNDLYFQGSNYFQVLKFWLLFLLSRHARLCHRMHTNKTNSLPVSGSWEKPLNLLRWNLSCLILKDTVHPTQ